MKGNSEHKKSGIFKGVEFFFKKKVILLILYMNNLAIYFNLLF